MWRWLTFPNPRPLPPPLGSRFMERQHSSVFLPEAIFVASLHLRWKMSRLRASAVLTQPWYTAPWWLLRHLNRLGLILLGAQAWRKEDTRVRHKGRFLFIHIVHINNLRLTTSSLRFRHPKPLTCVCVCVSSYMFENVTSATQTTTVHSPPTRWRSAHGVRICKFPARYNL